jgi:hypothetical protein
MTNLQKQLDEMVAATCVVCGGVVEPAYRGTSTRPKCESCQCSTWLRLKCRGRSMSRPFLVPEKTT